MHLQHLRHLLQAPRRYRRVGSTRWPQNLYQERMRSPFFTEDPDLPKMEALRRKRLVIRWLTKRVSAPLEADEEFLRNSVSFLIPPAAAAAVNIGGAPNFEEWECLSEEVRAETMLILREPFHALLGRGPHGNQPAGQGATNPERMMVHGPFEEAPDAETGLRLSNTWVRQAYREGRGLPPTPPRSDASSTGSQPAYWEGCVEEGEDTNFRLACGP